MVLEAWRALLLKDYEYAMVLSNKCLQLHKRQAIRQQSFLNKEKAFPKANELSSFGVLNDVGTCCFIKIRAYVEQNKIKDAKEMFRILKVDFSYAQMVQLDGKTIGIVKAVNKIYPNLLENIIPAGRTACIFYTIGILLLITARETIATIKKNLHGSNAPSQKHFEIKRSSALNWKDRCLFIGLLALELYSMVNFIIFWAHPIHWYHHFVSWPLFSFITFIGLFFISFYLYVWFLLWSSKVPEFVPAQAGLKVAMATTYVQNEPIELVKNTLLKMKAVKYPHDVFVLDESNNQELRAFCFKNGVMHFSRKGIDKYNTSTPPFQAKTKAGNLNAWLNAYAGRYGFVTFLDPDHQPEPAYLDRILGYFKDNSVAFVQAPHVYNNTKDGWIARGGAEQNYYFVSPIQPGLYGNDCCLVNGSHSTFRIKALSDIGGYAVHNADDILTSLRLHGKKWKGVYVPEILAYGLTPNNWGDYLSQQYRWAHSMFDLLFFQYPKLVFGLKFTQFLGYLSVGVFYIFAINFLVLTALPAVSILMFKAVANVNLAVFLQNFLAFYIAKMAFLIFWSQKFLLRNQERGVWWRGGLLLLGSAPHILFAFLRALSRKGLLRTKFVTPQWRDIANLSYLKLFVFHLALIIFYSVVFVYSFTLEANISIIIGTRIFLLMSIVVLFGITLTSTKLFLNYFRKE